MLIRQRHKVQTGIAIGNLRDTYCRLPLPFGWEASVNIMPHSGWKPFLEFNSAAHGFFISLDMTSADNNILDQVKSFADAAHGDQTRRYTNERYIVHPVRVMETVREYRQDLPVLAAALLHDVLEDTSVGKRELQNFLVKTMREPDAYTTLRLVEELTDVYIKADYPALNRRARRLKEVERLSGCSPDAQTIKYADIIDNVVDIVHHDNDFALIFIRECKQLLDGLTKGHPKLYERAIQTVNDCMREFWDNANVKAL